MPDRKNIAREIFRQTVASIDIPGTMERKLFLEGKRLILPDASVDLSEISEVRVVAIGKAAHSMVAGLPCILPDGLPVCGVFSAPTKPQVARPGGENHSWSYRCARGKGVCAGLWSDVARPDNDCRCRTDPRAIRPAQTLSPSIAPLARCRELAGNAQGWPPGLP